MAQERFSVLIVDDDPTTGHLVGAHVRRALPDATIVTVEDAERALVAVKEQVPDVILLDLQLPRMNGIELCTILRGEHLADRCTIIVVSAGASDGDVELLRQLGVTRFVPKGWDLGTKLTANLREIHDAWELSRG